MTILTKFVIVCENCHSTNVNIQGYESITGADVTCNDCNEEEHIN